MFRTSQKCKSGAHTYRPPFCQFILNGCLSFQIISVILHIWPCILLYMCVCEAFSASWLTGWVRFCSYWSPTQNCHAGVFPKKRSVLADRDVVLCYYHILSCSVSIFVTFHWSKEHTVRNWNMNRVRMTFWPQPSS